MVAATPTGFFIHLALLLLTDTVAQLQQCLAPSACCLHHCCSAIQAKTALYVVAVTPVGFAIHLALRLLTDTVAKLQQCLAPLRAACTAAAVLSNLESAL